MASTIKLLSISPSIKTMRIFAGSASSHESTKSCSFSKVLFCTTVLSQNDEVRDWSKIHPAQSVTFNIYRPAGDVVHCS